MRNRHAAFLVFISVIVASTLIFAPNASSIATGESVSATDIAELSEIEQATMEPPYEGTRQYSGIHCGSGAVGTGRILQRNGRLAYCTSGWYAFELPATRFPGKENRRTEVFWGTSASARRYKQNEVMVFEGTVVADLGAASNTTHDFHFLWQSHGPKTDGTEFKGPLMHLNVSSGRLTLGGGRGYPGRSDARWYKDMGKFENNKAYRFRVEVKLSSNPNVGWVSAWINGKQKLDYFHPKRGTFYPGCAWVSSRGGIYRGSTGAAHPTYMQRVLWNPTHVS